jgi:hypothetical protein
MRLFLLPCAFMFLLVSTACKFGFAAEIQDGKLLYMQYCSACHGEQGHGNGPVSRYIAVKIPDLTLLKKTNRGVYPSDQVLSAVATSGLMAIVKCQFGAKFSPSKSESILNEAVV